MGKSFPLYVSGPASVGWWAMFITMVGDGTAFASLLFGYFFYWTIHDDFTAGAAGPGMMWPLIAGALFIAAWLAMMAARSVNDRDWTATTRLLLVLALALTLCGTAAGFMGPYTHAMEPTRHVYPAVVWVLVIWTSAHAAVAVIMQAYCLARSFAGRLTGTYDQDLRNVVLYWHFMLATAVGTFATIGLFPSLR